MSELAACRMCLAVDARMYTIAGTPLQHVYERITDIPLQNGDKRPKKVCYLCCHLLRKNQVFMEKSVKADELLRLVLDRGIELTEEYIRLMDKSDVCSSLSVARPEFINFVSQHTDLETQEQASTVTHVKDEPSDVKEETELVENSEQDEDLGIGTWEAKINMILHDHSYCRDIDDEEAVDPDNEAPPSDDEANNPLTRTGLISECPENVQNGRTASTQRTPNNAANEANQSISTECGSDVKPLLDITPSSERSTDAEHSDATPQSRQENCSELNAQLAPNASPKLTPKYVMICEQCGIAFKSLRLYENHRKISHAMSFICDHCKEVFDNRPSLIVHVRTHMSNDYMLHQTARYRKTAEGFLNKSSIKKHTAKKQYLCEYCKAGFTYKRSLIKHLRKHEGEKSHRCSHCNREFSWKTSLKRHLLIHTGEKPHRCSHCNKSFRDRSSFKKHVLIHTGGKPHRCSHCNKAFSQKVHLNTHMLLHTGGKPHRCSQCNKAFSRKSHLKIHMLIHTGEKPYRCSHCNKAFSRKSTLKIHMFIHTGEKLHRCSHCDKAFYHKSTLKTHMFIHTGEKPYRCSHCNKAFSQKSNLKTHMLIHTGEKPHRCSHCNKSFIDRSSFKKHVLIHTGGKPHRCSHCNKAFSQKVNLNRHMLLHTGEKPHRCSHCNKAFSQKSHLKTHANTHRGKTASLQSMQ